MGMEVETGMEVMETGMELRLWVEVGLEMSAPVFVFRPLLLPPPSRQIGNQPRDSRLP